MDRQPNVQLLKSRLQTGLEIDEKLPVLLRVFGVHEDSIQLIAVFNLAATPDAFDGLGFPRDSAKPALDFRRSIGEKLARYRPAVVKRQRQENLEATKYAHAWQVPQP